MEIEVELTEQDYIDFYKAYGLERNWPGKAIAFVLIDIILCSIVGTSSSAFLLLLIIFTGILYLFFFQIPYLRVKNKFRAVYVRDQTSLLKKN